MPGIGIGECDAFCDANRQQMRALFERPTATKCSGRARCPTCSPTSRTAVCDFSSRVPLRPPSPPISSPFPLPPLPASLLHDSAASRHRAPRVWLPPNSTFSSSQFARQIARHRSFRLPRQLRLWATLAVEAASQRSTRSASCSSPSGCATRHCPPGGSCAPSGMPAHSASRTARAPLVALPPKYIL